MRIRKEAGGDEEPDGLASCTVPLVVHLPSRLDFTLTLSPMPKLSLDLLPLRLAILSWTAWRLSTNALLSTSLDMELGK